MGSVAPDIVHGGRSDSIVLRDVDVPAFGVPLEAPRIPAATYEARCGDAYRRAGCDWLVVYADREHLANIAFLSGHDPRFEEALLMLGPGEQRVLVVGNEGEAYAPLARLPGLEIALAQSMSLMGQDRALKPDLAAVLRDVGLSRGQTIGLVGWKYFEPAEWDDASPGLFVPQYLAAMLSRIAGGAEALKEATPVLMHPTTGLRSTIDADQIALHEWGAARASAAVWRILTGTQLGVTEHEAASLMGYAGEVLSAHVMYATGDLSHPVIGLRSPGGRILRRGDGVTAGVGFWGGLSARAGLIADYDEAFLKTAAAYFDGLVAWYAAADIGVTGEAVFTAVREASHAAACALLSIRATSPGTTSGFIRPFGQAPPSASRLACRFRSISFRLPCGLDGRSIARTAWFSPTPRSAPS
jgi:hypothetical protein